jgi:hypothetical protein
MVEECGAPSAVIHGSFEQIALSISHSGSWTACAALRSPTAAMIGIDVERVDPGLVNLARRFASPEEVRWASDCYGTAGATLLWSAKESAIKCVKGRTLSRRSFLVTAPKHGVLQVLLCDRDSGARTILSGGFVALSDYCLTWLCAPHAAAPLEQLPPLPLEQLFEFQCESWT